MTEEVDVRQRLRTEWNRLETNLRALEDGQTSDLLLMRVLGVLAQANNRLSNLAIELEMSLWPEPTVPQPGMETLEEWMMEDGGCEATDGCWIEVDGRCPHGHPSWMLVLGLV